jgi:hypothetical protein
MKWALMVVLLALLAGCGSFNEASGSLGTKPTPSPGAKPATKRELPWLTVTGGRMKTTLFYGPWQCRREFMNQCQRECVGENYPLPSVNYFFPLATITLPHRVDVLTALTSSSP